MPGLEEGLWPWKLCPGCHPSVVMGQHPVRLRIMFDGAEVFDVDVLLCGRHKEAGPQERAQVEASLGERWDQHTKPAMDPLILSHGAPALPDWEEATVVWPTAWRSDRG